MKHAPQRLFCLMLMPIALPASAEPQWPDYLDIDLNFRNSARLTDGQRWDFRLGAGIESEPTYQGSDKNDSEVDPLLVVAYRADWGNVFLSGEGLGYSRMLTPRFGIQLALEAEDTREVDDDNRLTGLGNQDKETELEIFGRYFLGPLTVGGSVAVATGDKGLVWFVGSTYTWRMADDRLFLTLGADLSSSNKDNQQTDFGITQAQSDASGFPVYSPSGGLKSFGIRLDAEYQLSRRWYLRAGIDYERLLGDVADSPIVFDENNIEASLGFMYRF